MERNNEAWQNRFQQQQQKINKQSTVLITMS